MFKEFKDFAVKGNVVDMAVGIIIGAAFGTIVTALVDGVLMPPIGLLLGGVDFSNLFILLKEGTTPAPYETLVAAQEAGAVVMAWGSLVTTIISFLIVAFAVFMFVTWINRLKREEEAAPDEPAAPSEEAVLLGEIRDALKSQAAG